MAKSELSLPFDGERLRQYRERAGLFQGELGKLCDVDQSRISQLESGGTKPSPPLLKQLARVLKIRVDDLLTPEDEEQAEASA